MGNIFGSSLQDQTHSSIKSGEPILPSAQTENLNCDSQACTTVPDEVQTSSNFLNHHSSAQNEIQTHSSIKNKVSTLFNTPDEIQTDSDVQSKQAKFLCQTCNCTFKFRTEFRKHMLTHSDHKLPPTKSICKRIFKKLNNSQSHARPNSCSTCGNCFKSKRSLKNHERSHVADGIYRCNLCNRAFKQLTHLKIHATMKSHGPILSKTIIKNEVSMTYSVQSDAQILDSNVCCETQTFTSSTSFSTHIKTPVQRDETLFSCQICNCSFTSNRDLCKHSRIHCDNIHISGCDVCEKNSKRKERSQTQEKSFQCDMCSGVFKGKDDLWRHSDNERRHLCKICYLTCKQSDHLQRHFQSHKKRINGALKSKKTVLARRKTCKDDLTYPHRVIREKLTKQNGFKASSKAHAGALLRRISGHKNDKTFSCSICRKTFKLKKYLSQHLPVHNAKRSTSCNSRSNQVISSKIMRKKIIAKKKNLQSSLPILTRKQFYCCNTCDRRFKTKAVLQQHSSVHKDKKSSNHVCKETFKIKIEGENVYTKKEYLHSEAQAKKQSLKCDVCNKKFLYKSSLELHSVVHKEARPFICTNCNAAYKRKDKLVAHTYRCPERKHQMTEDALQWHLVPSTPMEWTNTNNCPSCLKTFDLYNSLVEHMKVCTAYAELVKKEQKVEKIESKKAENGLHCRDYQCLTCNEIFFHAKYFADHLKNKHDIRFFIHKCADYCRFTG